MNISEKVYVKQGIRYKVIPEEGHVVIIVTNPKTGKKKVCECDFPYSFRDGYNEQDVAMIHSIINDFVRELKKNE